ncbi:hypothetical protein BDN70DRAFT_689905 [Pholiota conissans]|uniref:Uncharacterized protein n=1 Tax=Pholiota conissans TaxID=109636 RepID=A0A9P5Z2D9_9AGAR|nr:hypothetical protein BDN70DRAFT_689905 [Pholiota conissans]
MSQSNMMLLAPLPTRLLVIIRETKLFLTEVDACTHHIGHVYVLQSLVPPHPPYGSSAQHPCYSSQLAFCLVPKFVNSPPTRQGRFWRPTRKHSAVDATLCARSGMDLVIPVAADVANPIRRLKTEARRSFSVASCIPVWICAMNASAPE